MEVFLVWVEGSYDDRDLYGCFSTEEKAKEWIENNLDIQDRRYAYVEHHHVD